MNIISMNDNKTLKLLIYTFTLNYTILIIITYNLLSYKTLSFDFNPSNTIVNIGPNFLLPKINSKTILFAGALKAVVAADVRTWRDFHKGLKHDPG